MIDLEFRPTLESFVAPLSAKTFLNDHWKQKPFYVKGSEARLTSLIADFGILELRELVAQGSALQVWGKDVGVNPSIDEALQAYKEEGATLYFQVDPNSKVRQWAVEIGKGLGETAANCQLGMFAVTANHGSIPHFDRNENFTVQLQGTKRWYVAPNGFVDNPDDNWVINSPPPPYSDAKKVPKEMPEDAVEYVLGPGDVLYVPRGWLHQVTAKNENSLSCNFLFRNILWGDVIVYVLRKRLFRDPKLRGSLTGVFGTGWNLSVAMQELDEALKVTEAAVAELGVSEFLQFISED